MLNFSSHQYTIEWIYTMVWKYNKDIQALSDLSPIPPIPGRPQQDRGGETMTN